MNAKSDAVTVKPEPTVPADAGLFAPVTRPVPKMPRVAATAATIWILRFDFDPEEGPPEEACVRWSTASFRVRRRAISALFPNMCSVPLRPVLRPSAGAGTTIPRPGRKSNESFACGPRAQPTGGSIGTRDLSLWRNTYRARCGTLAAGVLLHLAFRQNRRRIDSYRVTSRVSGAAEAYLRTFT